MMIYRQAMRYRSRETDSRIMSNVTCHMSHLALMAPILHQAFKDPALGGWFQRRAESLAGMCPRDKGWMMPTPVTHVFLAIFHSDTFFISSIIHCSSCLMHRNGFTIFNARYDQVYPPCLKRFRNCTASCFVSTLTADACSDTTIF